MKSHIITLVVALLFGCSSTNNKEAISCNNQVIDTLNIISANYNYSKLNEFNHRTIISDLRMGLKYQALNEEQKNYLKLENWIKEIVDQEYYNAYFFSKQKSSNGYLPIVVYITSTHYNSLNLILLKDHCIIVDVLELTENDSRLVKQDNIVEISWIKEKITSIDENIFSITKKKITTEDYGDSIKYLIDSINYSATIDYDNDGQIVEKMTDSTRLYRSP